VIRVLRVLTALREFKVQLAQMEPQVQLVQPALTARFLAPKVQLVLTERPVKLVLLVQTALQEFKVLLVQMV
jgi:hypothetical protein